MVDPSLPAVSAIVVSWNTREILRGCLSSVERHLASIPHELIVVDNASDDGSPEMVQREFPGARLLRNEANLGFGRGANRGMQTARAPLCLLLNSDAYLLDSSLGDLAARMQSSLSVGVAGPRVLLDESGRIQYSARRFPSVARIALAELWLYRLMPRSRAANALLGSHWDHAQEREVDWLVGACLLVRREAFEQTGGFDPAIFMYGEEVEWCYRIREKGWRILFSPSAQVLHLNHKSADRLFGDAGRMDRCVLADDDLLGRWQGWWAPPLAAVPRLAGALMRLCAFGMRRLLQPGDQYAQDMMADARAMLAHYGRRLTGRVGRPVPGDAR